MNKPSGIIDYVELPVLDLSESKEFYGTLFGWTFRDWGETYVSFHGSGLEGGFRLVEQIRAGGPLLVLYSQDLEKTLREVRATGVPVVQEIFSFPGGRRFHFHDPSGHELAVWSEIAGA